MQRSRHPVLAGVFALTLLTAGTAPLDARASGNYGEEPAREFAMVGDIFFARPVLAFITGAGLATFTASLPLSALGGNVDEAAESLVRAPARNTFLRCLACTPAEHEQKRREERIRRREAERE